MKFRSTAEATLPAYSVYAYVRPPQERGDINDWERTRITHDKLLAFREAKDLYQSNRYIKVEVRQLSFDMKRDRKIDRSLKIFGDRWWARPVSSSTILLTAFLFGVSTAYVLSAVAAVLIG